MNSEFQPIIIQSHETNRLNNAETNSDFYSQEPYLTAKKEATDLIHQLSFIPQSVNELATLCLTRINPEDHGVSQNNFAAMMHPLLTDIATLSTKAKQLDPIEKVYVHTPTSKHTYEYVTKEVHQFLTHSRFLGIVPFNTLNKLKDQPILSIGASVGASTLDQLVSAGAENSTLIDDGFLEPSNQPRMPIGNIIHNGQSKIKTVLEQQYARNPFGNYKAIAGRIVPTAEDKQTPQDIAFDEVINGNEVIIEAIDSVAIKIKLRQYLRTYHPNTPLFMPTDVGINPYVSVEQGAANPLFNQPIFEDPNAINFLLDHQEAGLSAVYHMVESHFPHEHVAEFVAIRLGLINFWSQIPSSARESGAMTTLLLLKYLQDGKIESKNYTNLNLPETLMPYSSIDQQNISTIARSLFSLS